MNVVPASRCASVLVTVGLVVGCAGRDPKIGYEGEGEGGEGEGAPLPAACAEDTNHVVAPNPGFIYFGTRVPTMVPLTPGQVNAVIGITDDDAAGTGSFCSGTLITPTVVLTARHCTIDDSAAKLHVLIGPDDLNPLDTVDVTSKHETNDTIDISVIVLEHAPADDGVVIEPIPLTLDEPRDEMVGGFVENAGFGENEDAGYHGRFFVTEQLDSFDPQFIQVNGHSTRGVCFGDSGGPIMRVSAAGDVRVLGALSFGDAECMGIDNYSRADTIRASFIEVITGPTPTAPAPEACPSDVTEQGACNLEQQLATFCEGAVVVRTQCGAGEVCADDGTGKNRCVSTSSTPCGDALAYGACDGQTLTWCDAGVKKTRTCDACNERCTLADPTIGYSCVESDCGDLDRLGTCDGNTSKWCDLFGSKETEDCAAEQTTCEFLGSDLGYYCLDKEACQGFDYAGSCDGTKLTWCEDNELNNAECNDPTNGTTTCACDPTNGCDCN